MMIHNLFRLIIFCSLVILIPSTINAANLYRFINDEGVQSIGTSLPPSAAPRGYDILDAQTMRLIKRVSPALTEAQIEELEQKERKQKLADEQRKKQAIYDKRLLSLYQSEQDVEDAKQRDVNAKQITLEQTKLSLTELEIKQTQLQQQAADDELSGGITPKTQKAMTQNTQRINETKQLITALEKEIATLTAQYEADAARLRELRN